MKTKSKTLPLVLLFTGVMIVLAVANTSKIYAANVSDPQNREPDFALTWLGLSPIDYSFLVPPRIDSISPSTPQRSTTDQIIRVNGANFASGLTVTVTFPGGGTGTLSGSQIQNRTSSGFDAIVTMNGVGQFCFRVNNPNLESSNNFCFNVVAAQTPDINSTNPSSPSASNSDQNVVVSGVNFQNGMTVTVFFPGGGSGTLSGTQLQNVTPTSFTMRATLNLGGSYGIRINNPSGLQSDVHNFTVRPRITSTLPSSPCVRNVNQNVAVNGAGFQGGLTVTVTFSTGGSAVLSGSQIQNVTPASFTMVITLAEPGTYTLRVNNPSPSAQSDNFNLTPQNCLSVTGTNPNSPFQGNVDQPVQVQGSGFSSGLTVIGNTPGGNAFTLSGSQIQNVTSSSFTMVITLNATGNWTFKVRNSNGDLSNLRTLTVQSPPAPTISSISPSSPCVRNVDQAVTVTGSNFVAGLTALITLPSGTTVTLSGSQIQNVTPTSFTMIVTLAGPGNYSIRVNNPGGGTPSDPFTFSPQNCLSVTGTNPASPIQSNVDQSVQVQGSGFANGLTVTGNMPNGTPFTLSGTQIQNVTASSFTMLITLNATGNWTFKVRNPNGDLSNERTLSVQAQAQPTVSAINPSSPVSSSVDQNIDVTGTNFVQGLTVTVSFPGGGSGTLQGTQIQNVTSSSFRMRITLGGPGQWSLRVNNPNGGQSAQFPFSVQTNVQQPVIFSINPITPIARSTDQDVIVTGSNFQQGLTIPISFPGGGGTTLSGAQIQNVTSTSFIMRATLNASGGWSIRINNPDGGQSAPFGFSVANGTSTVINSINPSTPIINGADQDVIVNGSNFQNGLKVNATFPNGGMAVLQGNGQIQNVTSTSFKLRITLNDTGNWTIRVVNPDNSQSQQFQFSVNPAGPPPTGLPTSVLSPVLGPLRVTNSNLGISDGKWEFNQHKTALHTTTGGVQRSNDVYAWDTNLYLPGNGNGDVGKAVFATAPGQVVEYVGIDPGAGPGAVLIAHPNATSPIWFSGYLHMTNVQVQTIGQFVNSDSILGEIGRVGAGNDHLHFVIYSGENLRGSLRSFNATILERTISGTNAPTIASIDPPSTVQSDGFQQIILSGTNFRSDSVIELQTPAGQNFTIVPESVSGVQSGKLPSTTSSTMTARVPFRYAGNYALTVINRSGGQSQASPENSSFTTSSSAEYHVAAGALKMPIVLIPGIMGSRLGKRQGPNSFDEIFPTLPRSANHAQLKNNIGYGNPIDQRPIVATDILRSYFGLPIYDGLIDALTGPYGGYKLYEASNPNQRTFVGCDFSPRNENANLYVFPYDWRSGNEQSARDLREFIKCIEQRHIIIPNFKINIIAHSMGGLVARRYILDGLYGPQPYNPKVNRLVTLGTPWLGAPKFILTLEEGDSGNIYVNGLLGKDRIKDVARYMQGAHELIPSRAYMNELADTNPGDFPFGEDGWDYDGRNGIRPRYDFSELEYLMNTRQVPNTDPPHTTILPGTNTDAFHNRRYLDNRALQDNWSGDQTGVTYYNFVGRCLSNQGTYNTVGSVIALRKPLYNPQNSTFVYRNVLEPKMQRGDCTVPEISGMRQSGRGNYLGPAQALAFENVEHGGLPNDPRVIECIKFVFAGQSPSTCYVGNPQNLRSRAQEILDEQPYNISLLGSQSVTIKDAFGNTSNPLSTSEDEGVPTIATNVTGDDYVHAILPQDQEYSIIFRTSSSPLSLVITKGQNENTTLAIRYLDLSIPSNVSAQLIVSPAGVSTLKYDSDGDGTFETPVQPIVIVNGPTAADLEPPTVRVNETAHSGTSRIDLEATDGGAGVQRIMYSLNGTTFQQYSTPLNLNPNTTPTIYVFADDNVYNRSGVLTHNLTASSSGFQVSGPALATPGATITANFSAPSGRPSSDWIGLFRMGSLNSAFLAKVPTGGVTSGSVQVTLPALPGPYELRYLLNDGFTSVTASAPIQTSTEPVAISGRVIGHGSRGNHVALLSLTDSQGTVRWSRTNGFGYYRFLNVPRGGTYTIRVFSKGLLVYSPITISAIDNINLELVPNL